MNLSIKEESRIAKNPFLLFLPFLLLYIIFVVMMHTDKIVGDGTRYLHLVENLLSGYYSKPYPDVDLPNGPGYPIFLVPFVAFKLPLIFVTLANAVMHYLSIVFLYKALRRLVPFKLALGVSIFWGCYYVAFQNMAAVTTETLSIFLLSLFLFLLVKAFSPDQAGRKKFLCWAGFVLGFIALTKVIFGIVILLSLLGCVLLVLMKRKLPNYRKALLVLGIGFLTTVPYLAYTYHLTGRMLYWGTGSDNLYWMSSPYEDEYGDWKGELVRGSTELGNYNIPGSEDTLRVRHQPDYDRAYSKTGVDRDDVFKSIAVANIKAHPVKYGKNIFYNMGRMFFHYPYSYAVERRISLFAMLINSIMLTFILICLVPTLLSWKRMAFPVRFLLWVLAIYWCGSSLLASDLRMFANIVPAVLLWIAYILNKTVRIKCKIEDGATAP